jgi:HK97 gp10 family phage protein
MLRAFCVMVKRAGKLKKMRGAATNAIKRGLIISGMLVAQRATRRAPRLTGRLKRSITHGKPYKRGRTGWAIDVGTNVEYARAQELGSGIHAEGGGQPYPIRPVKKKALAFVWPDAPAHIKPSPETGKVVLAKVMHPGVKPQPYLRPALNASIQEIKGILLSSLITGLRKM